jgi:hypothetical protein
VLNLVEAVIGMLAADVGLGAVGPVADVDHTKDETCLADLADRHAISGPRDDVEIQKVLVWTPATDHIEAHVADHDWWCRCIIQLDHWPGGSSRARVVVSNGQWNLILFATRDFDAETFEVVSRVAISHSNNAKDEVIT